MSLDFCLYFEHPETEHARAVKLLREAGLNAAASCLDCQLDPDAIGPVFDTNITHNLNIMAQEAGIYIPLWRPEELNITMAGELIVPLTVGLQLLESDRPRFERFNSQNGWGKYENFVPFVRRILDACTKYPTAKISVSR